MAECYKVAAFDGFNKISYDNLCTLSCDSKTEQTVEESSELEFVPAT
jgi:hypothetical protein